MPQRQKTLSRDHGDVALWFGGQWYAAPMLLNRFALAVVLAAAGATAAVAQDPAGLQTGVTFTDYTPFSESRELLRRELTPLAFAQVVPDLARFPAQSIDLANEHFLVYVPSSP